MTFLISNHTDKRIRQTWFFSNSEISSTSTARRKQKLILSKYYVFVPIGHWWDGMLRPVTRSMYWQWSPVELWCQCQIIAQVLHLTTNIHQVITINNKLKSAWCLLEWVCMSNSWVTGVHRPSLWSKHNSCWQ